MSKKKTLLQRLVLLVHWIIVIWFLAMTASVIVVFIDRSNMAQAKEMHTVAAKYTGLHERKNNRALRRLLGVNPARVPWCGYFVATVARQAGKRPPRGFPAARSWTRFSKPVRPSQARRGDVVVVKNRRWHVGIFHSRKNGKVCLLGGNQSNGVRVSCYPSRRVRAVRR